MHTPGPWAFTYLSGGLMGVCAKGFGLLFSADIYRKYAPMPDEIEANLRLCAAAPDLLAVVQRIAWTYESEQKAGKFPAGQTWLTVPHDLGQIARTAIATATGRA